jgi:hypothetical protein
LIFCSEPVQPGGAGATSKDIRKALRKLKDDGQSATEGLYVFFSGHGFPWGPEPSRDFTTRTCSLPPIMSMHSSTHSSQINTTSLQFLNYSTFPQLIAHDA